MQHRGSAQHIGLTAVRVGSLWLKTVAEDVERLLQAYYCWAAGTGVVFEDNN